MNPVPTARICWRHLLRLQFRAPPAQGGERFHLRRQFSLSPCLAVRSSARPPPPPPSGLPPLSNSASDTSDENLSSNIKIPKITYYEKTVGSTDPPKKLFSIKNASDIENLRSNISEIEKLQREMEGNDPQLLSPDEDDPASPTVPLKMRIKQTSSGNTDEQNHHRMALRRLRVSLPAPYDKHPHIRRLNECLTAAYMGANAQVRRELWRAYERAKHALGRDTLLPVLSNDAWDMMWYSQAVKWASNTGREQHLEILREDLGFVGRDGPPTKAQDA